MASFRHAREDFRPAMNEAFGPIRLIHILAGAIALVIGPLAMITFKGGRWHRRWGKIYFWAMATVALTALIMCWLRSGLFLFLVAIFSFYLALTGYTVLRRKTPQDRPQPLDWIAALIVCLASVTLIAYGGFWVQSSARWICLAFGIIGLLLGGSEIKSFLRPPIDKRAWYYAHMIRFLAAYVATVTAFSAVNFSFLPTIWRWLWPTLIGIPAIKLCKHYYQRKFTKP